MAGWRDHPAKAASRSRLPPKAEETTRAVIATMVAALVLLLTACVCAQQGDPPQQLAATAPQPCDEATEQLVREMTLKAVQQSFQDHVQKLFDVWMREETLGHRERIERGMTKAIKAYLQSRASIERWQGLCR